MASCLAASQKTSSVSAFSLVPVSISLSLASELSVWHMTMNEHCMLTHLCLQPGDEISFAIYLLLETKPRAYL